MTDAFVIQKYERCKEIAKETNLSFYVKGGSIRIENESKEHLGSIESVNELFSYLCGYDEGYKKGRLK